MSVQYFHTTHIFLLTIPLCPTHNMTQISCDLDQQHLVITVSVLLHITSSLSHELIGQHPCFGTRKNLNFKLSLMTNSH
jgi:hypothetical protein